MRYDYLIEIRPLIEKLKLKQKIDELKKELRLKNAHRVPHLTLIYNFRPKIQNYKIAELIKETASKYENLCFEYSGWDLIEKERGYVFGFKIKPSNELKEFRYELYHNIKNSIIEDPRKKKFNTLSKDDFWFHLAITIHLDIKTAERIDKFVKNENAERTFFDKIFNFLKNKDSTRTERVRKPLLLPSEVARIPILRSGKITYEYDKFTNRILKRNEALSKKYKGSTLEAYRKKKKIELIPNNDKDSKNQTWLISDTHFDHANIIDLCARPFADVDEMNNILVDNCNYTINKQDKVYFLGDIGRPEDYWLDKLNGKITFIRGNHDECRKHGFNNDPYCSRCNQRSRLTRVEKPYEKLDYKGHKFLLHHYPNKIPIEWNDWIIHGHTHNNDLEECPLINWKQKTVNVSVELIKYRQINFDKIIELIENKKEQNILTLY